MTIPQLIALAANRLAALNSARATAVTLGDIARLDALDAGIAETQATIDKLNTL
jgi:hypothetical protein